MYAFSIDPGEIARINRYKSQAQEAFESENYQDAITSYSFLIDSLGVDDPKIRLNIAHCYFRMGDMEKSAASYSFLDQAEDNKIASVANQQLGFIKAKNKKYENALQNFKEAVKNNPFNEDARMGYEVVKKLIEDQKKKEEEQNKDKQEKQKDQQQDQQQNQDQQNQQDKEENKDQENQQNQQNKDKEEKEKEKTDKQNQENPQESKNTEEQKSDPKEQQMEQHMSEIDKERAEMILRAMEEQEKQYYQQLKKKSKNQVPKNNKPDW